MADTLYRTIDGTNNNQDYNTAGSEFTRIGDAHFADGISVPLETVNPRTVSNQVVGEGDAAVPNAEGVSGMMYAWGQFLDHDLDLSQADGVNHIDITIPNGDPVFPDGSVLSMTRAVIDSATGAGTDTPATAVNSITGWLDGSMVYGSTQGVADSLRLSDGHMRTSEGDNLPLNADDTMAAGDVRAQENPSLTALQTLFVREHNYQVDKLAAEHPDWDGNHLYEQARAIVGAEIASITYNEFLPLLLGSGAPGEYTGYDPAVNPTISEEFAGAAFRFGHSIVSNETERVDENGVVTGPELELRDTFFLPAEQFNADGGADGFLRHLGTDASQAMDARIVDGLRNFLFDPPVGMDLAAINIQRGHDLGLGTLNETREALGLTPYTSFEQITDDAGTVAALKATFTDVSQIDLWTGGLSEKHVSGGLLGETFGKIIGDQFEALRDGDQYYYENVANGTFDAATLNEIQHTSLSDIIERVTDTEHMQANSFVFTERHASNVEAENPNAPQLIIGIDGNAVLTGGDQDDTLVAGTGRQVMTGGEGDDTFVFDYQQHGTDPSPSNATVVDFQSGHDVIEIDGAPNGSAFSDVKVSHRGDDTVIAIGGDHITLTGIHQVTASDFIFDT
jgi:Ca2+-binding RTX toxin-like protein